MSRSYPRDLREGLCERMLSGEKVVALSKESGICEGTLYRWKAQSKIDAGLKAGVKSYQSDELKRVNIPEVSAHLFRFIPHTDSGVSAQLKLRNHSRQRECDG